MDFFEQKNSNAQKNSFCTLSLWNEQTLAARAYGAKQCSAESSVGVFVSEEMFYDLPNMSSVS